jgi:hypothetical protein
VIAFEFFEMDADITVSVVIFVCRVIWIACKREKCSYKLIASYFIFNYSYSLSLHFYGG